MIDRVNKKENQRKIIYILLLSLIFILLLSNNVFAADGVMSDLVSKQFKNTEVSNIAKNFIKELESNLRNIGYILGLLMILYSAYELMFSPSAQGDIIQTVTKQERLKNAIIAICILTAIPFLGDSLNKTPLFNIESITIQDVTSDNFSLNNMQGIQFKTNETYGNSYYKSNKTILDDFLENQKIKDKLTAGSTSNISKVIDNFKAQITNETGITGIVAVVLNAIFFFLFGLVYGVLYFLNITLGVFSYMPIVFTDNFYSQGNGQLLNTYIAKSFNIGNAIGITKLVQWYLNGIGNGFDVFMKAILDIFVSFKSLAFIIIELVSYVYAISIMFNIKTFSINQIDGLDFLKKYFKAIFGITILPLIFQFLIDLDIIFSTTIMALSGVEDIVPGFGFLAILPTPSSFDFSNLQQVLLIILFIAVAWYTLKMNKEFLIRKMKILLYFIVSPLAFAFEMLPTGVNLSLEFFFNNIMPDIFKTTIYTPIFLLGVKLISIITNYGQYTDKISHAIVALVILLFFLSVVVQQYDDIINLFFKTSTFNTFLGAFKGEGTQGSFSSNMLASSVGNSILNDNGGLDNYKHNPNGVGTELSPLKAISSSTDFLDKISNKAADFVPLAPGWVGNKKKKAVEALKFGTQNNMSMRDYKELEIETLQEAQRELMTEQERLNQEEEYLVQQYNNMLEKDSNFAYTEKGQKMQNRIQTIMNRREEIQKTTRQLHLEMYNKQRELNDISGMQHKISNIAGTFNRYRKNQPNTTDIIQDNIQDEYFKKYNVTSYRTIPTRDRTTNNANSTNTVDTTDTVNSTNTTDTTNLNVNLNNKTTNITPNVRDIFSNIKVDKSNIPNNIKKTVNIINNNTRFRVSDIINNLNTTNTINSDENSNDEKITPLN